jgi:nucleotide-binding universal stress UspA family protein
MYTNIIVGVDEHQGGRDAIALATRLLADGGTLTLAYVYAGDLTAWRGSSPAYDATEHDRGLELLAAARSRAGIDAELDVRGAPSVGRGLHALADAHAADLLVVGSCRRGLLGRVLIADDTRASLNGAPCAVAIAPAGYEQHPALMREVGVGYDGSPESEHALAVARKLADELGAKTSAFEAVEIPSYFFLGGPMPIEGTYEQLVSEARNRIEALGDVEAHAAYGQTAEELALYGASLDLLVIGSRSYGPIGRLMHGSTAQQLARTARCPLLVLTRAARDAQTPDVTEDDREATVAGVS